MDTLAALALATDPPSPELLDRKPSRRGEFIISVDMMLQIVGQGIFQVISILTIYARGFEWWGQYLPADQQVSEAGVDIVTATIIFNTFVFYFNVFKNFFVNRTFIVILLITTVSQIIIVQVGGTAFKTSTTGLGFGGWAISILVGSMSLPVGLALRLLSISGLANWIEKTPSSFDRVLSSSSIALNMVPTTQNSDDTEQIRKSQSEHKPAGHISDSQQLEPSRKRWERAIKQTRLQLRIVKVFRAPISDRKHVEFNRRPNQTRSASFVDRSNTVPSPTMLSRRAMSSILHPEQSLLEEPEATQPTSPTQSRNMWETLRSVLQASNAFNRRHGRMDYATIQMVDPNRLRQSLAASPRRRLNTVPGTKLHQN
eukprot:jgi/Hompol1/5835/HPOL_004760-RA